MREVSNKDRRIGPEFWIALIAFVIAAIYMLTMLNAAEMRPVAPLDDAYIHFQYARQIALGFPWQYNTGDPISTGATSLLYPFLLSAGYRLGFQEDAIVWPAMLLGAVSLAISSVLIFRITCVLFEPRGGGEIPWRRPLAWMTSILFLLTGAIPWSFLNGMETGLFTLFLLAALYAFVAERQAAEALFLVLSAFVRPEGIFLAGIAWLVSLGQVLTDRHRSRRPFMLITLALLLASIPYLVNMALTGTPVATGAQAKSWFGNVPFIFIDLVGNMGRMAWFILERMALGFLASKPWPAAPGLLFLALIGGIALWRKGDRWTVLLVAGWFTVGMLLAAALITALWQVGRYQMPFLAILIPLVGVGIGSLLAVVSPGWRKAAAVVFLLWGVLALVSSLQALRAYHDSVASMLGLQIAMADTINNRLQEGDVVAVHDAGATKYLGNRQTYDMIGLTTQGVADAWRHGSGAIFELMQRADKRPTHFATYPDVATIPYLAETSLFDEELFVTGSFDARTANAAGPVQVLYKADWTPAENGDLPRQSDMLGLLKNMILLESIDLADLVDEQEKQLSWSVGRTQPGFPTEARQFVYQTDPQMELLDGGRLISGAISFPVTPPPGQPLTLVARLHPQEAGALAVSVNGREAGLWRYPAALGRWLETSFEIPGSLFESADVQITLKLLDEAGQAQPLGIYYLWAYQGKPQTAETTPQFTLGHRLGPGITLQGYDLAANVLLPGQDLPLTLYWSAEDSSDLDAKVFLHLYDQYGELAAQIDQRPFFDTRPPYTWRPGEQITDPYHLDHLLDLPPGEYDIAVGMYDPGSGERLTAVTQQGEALPENRVFLGKILVKE
ncbi:MAG: hypothetical protein ACK2U5_07990 [Candidatus Promineifilaceae bacterium]